MTGRAIQGNIQFGGGSIVPPCGRANTATLKLNIPLYIPTEKECKNRKKKKKKKKIGRGGEKEKEKERIGEREKKSKNQSHWEARTRVPLLVKMAL